MTHLANLVHRFPQVRLCFITVQVVGCYLVEDHASQCMRSRRLLKGTKQYKILEHITIATY